MRRKGIWTTVVFLGSILSVFFSCNPIYAEGDPIILGAPIPLQSHYGIGAHRAAILAIEEINSKGGVNVGGVMRPFKLEALDTRDLEPGVPVAEALLTVEKLILEKKADFLIVGPVRSEAGMAAQDLVAKYKKISINSFSLTPAFKKRVEKNYPDLRYVFHTTIDFGWNAKNVMETFMVHLQEKYGLKRMFSLAQDVAYARATYPIFEKWMTAKGWEVVGSEVYPTGASDFSMGLFKMKKAKAQVLVTWADMPETAILIQQWNDLKVPVIPFGFNAAAEEIGAWEATHGKIEYALVTPIGCGNAPSEATPKTMLFTRAYKKRWGLPPEMHGTTPTYDTVYILKDAIERAKTIETEAVIKALEATDIVGAGGRLRFEPKSHQIIGSNDPKEGTLGTIFQWQKGERVVVWPESIAKGEVLLPPFMKDNM